MAEYQKFFNISHDLFCILDQDGFYKKVNPAFFDLLAYPEAELMGHPFVYFIHPDDVAVTVREYQEVKAGKHNQVVENRFRSRDGRYFWISWSTIVQDEAGNFYSCGQNITEQKHLRETLRREQEDSRRKVTRAIINTQEKERSRISQELHDNVNQVLTTVKLLMELSLEDGPNNQVTLERARKLQQEAIDEIRSLSKQLAAPSLANINLCDSVKDLLGSVAFTQKLKVSFHTAGLEDCRMDQYIHLMLFRILQEHFTNILKHAQARKVEVDLSQAEGVLSATVTDDGKGFDPNERSAGIGIQNMRTRAETVNGTLSLQSAPGKGCTLFIRIPLR
ncbi:PAS domain S-box protein [Paraflavisolibacter sp. H34]|uniref:PAS domain-containing sensor histidine kinase n=1 Tax=Huijunlia imazamoxiresistens TaxID=3127457 RepID=UPI00301B4690